MIPDSVIIDALNKTSGNVSAAARAIGMSRRQLFRRIQVNEALSELIDDLRHSLADDAETCIGDSIRAGDVNTAKWFLLSSYVGRSRGFSKTIDLSQPDDSYLDVQTIEVVVESREQVEKTLNLKEFEAIAELVRQRRLSNEE